MHSSTSISAKEVALARAAAVVRVLKPGWLYRRCRYFQARQSSSQLLGTRSEPGQEVEAEPGRKVRAVAIAHWKEELFRGGVIDRDAKNTRADFKRLKDPLAAADLVVERDGFAWPADAPSITPSFPPTRQAP